jgi:hypothetical protein
MMSAGMDPSTNLSKKVGALGLIAGSVEAAMAALATSSSEDMTLENRRLVVYLAVSRGVDIGSC